MQKFSGLPAVFFDSPTARTQILNYIFLATDDELVDIGLDVHLLNVGLILNMMEWIGTWPKKEQRALGLPFEEILEQMKEHCGGLADRLSAREETLKQQQPAMYNQLITQVQTEMAGYMIDRDMDVEMSSRGASPISLASIQIRDSDTEYQNSSPQRFSTPVSHPRFSTPMSPSRSLRSSVEPVSSPIVAAQHRRAPRQPQIVPVPATPQRVPSPAMSQHSTHPATPQLFPPPTTSRPNSRLGAPSKPSPLAPTGFIRAEKILSRPGTPQQQPAPLPPIPANAPAVTATRPITPQPAVASGSNVMLPANDIAPVEDPIPSRIPRRARKTRAPDRLPHTMASIEARAKKGGVEPTGDIIPMETLDADEEAEPPVRRAPKRVARGGTKVVNKGRK